MLTRELDALAFYLLIQQRVIDAKRCVLAVCGGQRAFGSAQQVSGRPYSDRLTVVCHAGLTQRNNPTITLFLLTGTSLKSVYTTNRPIHFLGVLDQQKLDYIGN